MKYDITDKDKLRIEQISANNAIVKYLHFTANNKFAVGDILVKQSLTFGDNPKWVTENISRVSRVTVKFLYVYEDENGVGFVKRIKTVGGLCEGVSCIADLYFHRERYIVDPDYADHIILGEEANYDATAVAKEFKAQRLKKYKANKKLLRDTSTWLKTNEILAKLAVGDNIWTGHDMYRAVKGKQTVVSITSRATTLSDVTEAGSKERKIGSEGVAAIYKIETTDGTGRVNIHSTEGLRHYCVFTQPPIEFEDCLASN